MSERKHVSHNVIFLWTLPAFVVFLAVYLILLILHYVLSLNFLDFGGLVSFPIALFIFLFVILVLPVLLYNELKYDNMTYEITKTNLVHRFGIINLKKVIIPLARIQDISYRRSFFERMLGLITIEIETAGSKSGIPECIIQGIPSNEREEFVKTLFKQVELARIDGLESRVTESMRIENILVDISHTLKDIREELKQQKENEKYLKKELLYSKKIDEELANFMKKYKNRKK